MKYMSNGKFMVIHLIARLTKKIFYLKMRYSSQS